MNKDSRPQETTVDITLEADLQAREVTARIHLPMMVITTLLAACLSLLSQVGTTDNGTRSYCPSTRTVVPTPTMLR